MKKWWGGGFFCIFAGGMSRSDGYFYMRYMSEIKNVIFDLGGVVVKWDPVSVLNSFKGDRAIVKYIRERGFFSDYWRDFDKGTLSQAELVRRTARLIGCSEESCEEFVLHVMHALVPQTETEELIRELSARGFKLYCLSNMSVEFYDYLKTREVFSYFDGQIISALEHLVKPDREIYELLLNRYHLRAEESLFIDDLQPNVEAAKRLGIQVVHFVPCQRVYDLIREKLR